MKVFKQQHEIMWYSCHPSSIIHKPTHHNLWLAGRSCHQCQCYIQGHHCRGGQSLWQYQQSGDFLLDSLCTVSMYTGLLCQCIWNPHISFLKCQGKILYTDTAFLYNVINSYNVVVFSWWPKCQNSHPVS